MKNNPLLYIFKGKVIKLQCYCIALNLKVLKRSSCRKRAFYSSMMRSIRS